ncbi:MAG TPA: PQQ-binding-like beta-propeller repeat protein [Mycobacteriales bacterium]|nr:PQQ-binding-like beta-propeller repeat protein [Mycobacteriales bacterium]
MTVRIADRVAVVVRGGPGRSRALVPAAALSVVAALLLATVWYADGTSSRRGPAVLAPITSAPDNVPGLGWVRLAIVLVLVALLTAIPAGRSRRAAGWTAALHALATLTTALAAWQLAGRATPAVPREAVVLAGAALAWTLVALRGRGTLPAGLAIVVAVAVLAPIGGPWWVSGRLVDRTTTDATAPTGGTGPAAPGPVRWQSATDRAAVFGPYVVFRTLATSGRPRIVVADAADGTERWSYRNADANAEFSADPATGVLVLALDRDGAGELRAFDLASGRPLWNRRDGGSVRGAGYPFHAGGTLMPAGVLLLLDQRAGRLRALDPRSGAMRWQRAVEAGCASSAQYVRAGDLLVVVSLCQSRTVPAYRVDTGADAWTATISDLPVISGGVNRPVLVAGGVAGIWFDEREQGVLAGVEVATGRVLWRRPAPAVEQLTGAVVAGRFVLPAPGRGRGPLAVALDPRTGSPQWTTGLPPTAATADPDEHEQLAGTDGTHWYLLQGLSPGGPGSTLLTVLDGTGRVVASRRYDGCGQFCAAAGAQPRDTGSLAGVGGTLVIVPDRRGITGQLVGISSG